MTYKDIEKKLPNDLPNEMVLPVVMVYMFHEECLTFQKLARLEAACKAVDVHAIIIFLRNKGWKENEDNIRLLMKYTRELKYIRVDPKTDRIINYVIDFYKK